MNEGLSPVQELAPAEVGQERILPDLSGKRILVVGDQAEARDVLYELVVLWGGECCEADNDTRALALAREGAAGGAPFDLALVDLNTCGARGLALARKFFADPLLKGLQVLFLNGEPCPPTAGGKPAFCVEKPVKLADLQQEIAKVLCGKVAGFPRRAKTRPPTGTAPRAQKILLVEDNPINQKATRMVLEKRGHRVVTAEHGGIALEYLRNERFDLVLMDIVMPEVDGIEATKAIRRGLGGLTRSDVPVLALTAHAEKADTENFLAAGINSFIAKPFQVQDLLAMVEEFARDE